MPMSEYMHGMRAKIGIDLIFMATASGVVINDVGNVLLHRRSDNGRWWLPGGAIEPGEQPAAAVIREVWEETGVTVRPERIVGVYGGLDLVSSYPNGDRIAVVAVTFACRPVNGEPRINDEESVEVRYFPPDALPDLHPQGYLRIEQALRNVPAAHFRFANK